MTIPVPDKEDIPPFIRKISRAANFLLTGQLAAFVFLMSDSVKRNLTSDIFHPPTLLYEITTMVITLSIVAVLPVCGLKAVEFIQNLISRKNG